MILKVTGIQLGIRDALSVKDRQANVHGALSLIKTIDQADLIVLPELLTVGYGRAAFDCLPLTAEAPEGDTFQQLAQAAVQKKAYIVYGFAEKAGDRCYNSVAVIDDKGSLVDTYRKLHIPQFADAVEKDYFDQGDRPVCFTVKGVKAGIMVCYDIRFPELARQLLVEGNMQLLIHPAGFTRDETFASWHPFVITRAVENQVYALGLNRAGANNGGSILVPPWVDDKCRPEILDTREELISADIDTDFIHRIRSTYPFIRDMNHQQEKPHESHSLQRS